MLSFHRESLALFQDTLVVLWRCIILIYTHCLGSSRVMNTPVFFMYTTHHVDFYIKIVSVNGARHIGGAL